jgi:acyl carrier protein
VELGEVEAAIGESGPAKEAGAKRVVVLAQKNGAGVSVLVAYVQLKEAKKRGPAELWRALREGVAKRLPKYMVPAAFVAVEGFAVNRNGKLDTAALPKPDLSSAAGGDEDEKEDARGAESEVEASVRAVVESVCGVSGVRRGTELLAIGVDSLKAMQLAARLGHELDTAVSVADVLECSTVADLVSLVGKGKDAERLPAWPKDLPALAAPYQVRGLEDVRP